MATVNTHSLDLELSSSQYASITNANQTGLNLSGYFTIEAWIKPESIIGTGVIASKYDFGAGNRQYSLSLDSLGRINLFLSDDGSSTSGHYLQFRSTTTISTGVYTHVAVTFDIATESATLYINSTADTFSLVSGTTIGATLHSSNADFSIGSSFNNSSATGFFDGLVDDVRVWSDVRTAAEIANYRNQDLVGNEANLVGYWKFDNDYLDATANNNDLTASGSPTFSTDVPFVSKSLDLEASSSQSASITDASQTGLDITGDITIEAWIKLETEASAIMPIFSKWKASTNERSYFFALYDNAGTKQIFFGISSDGASTGGNRRVNWTPSTGVWYHVAITYDASAGEIKFYVDGTQQGATQTGSSNSIYDGAGAVYVGYVENGGGFEYFDGLIDDVRVWSDVRTGTEINDNKDTELVGNEANLVGYWRLDNNYQDNTTNGNNLTASGSPVFSTDVDWQGVNIDITPSAQVATFSIPAYAVLAGDVLATPSAQVATLSIPAYSVLYGITTTPTAQVGTFSVPAYTISIAETLTPNAQVATFSIPTYAVLKGIVTSPDAQVVTFNIPTYSIFAETSVHPAAQVVTFSIPTYSLSISSVILPDAQVLTFSLPTLAKVGAIWTKTARATNATWSRSSRNSD